MKVNGGAVPAFGHTDDESAFRLLGALTVFELAREVGAAALKRTRHGSGLPTGDRALTRAARNLVLTEDFHLVARVARYARDILADYTADQLAALIGAIVLARRD